MSTTTEAVAGGRIVCPEPGVYPGVPAETYHRWDAPSNSLLKLGERSALHMRFAMLEPMDPTKYMHEGTALHTLVLEPHLYAELVVVKSQCAAEKKSGDQCSNEGNRYRDGHWFCGVKGHDPEPDALDDGTAGHVVLSEEAAGNVESTAQAVLEHPVVAKLLVGAERELSIVWDDPTTGQRCKARLDIWNPDLAMIGDIKKVQDASPDAFPRDFYNRRYYRQAAMYEDAVIYAGLAPMVDAVKFIAAELEPPHGAKVYDVDRDALRLGHEEYTALLRLYRDCVVNGAWPGYHEEPEMLSLPAWAAREISERLMRI